MKWRGRRLESLDSLLCRAVRDLYSALDSTGAALHGGRFNPRGVAALYLAPNPDLALRENLGLSGWDDLLAFSPRRIVCVRVRLSRVLDLASVGSTDALGLTLDDLLGDWLASDSPTQAVGQQAFIDGVEAIAFPSRIEPAERNFAVFRDNLLETSELRVVEADARP